MKTEQISMVTQIEDQKHWLKTDIEAGEDDYTSTEIIGKDGEKKLLVVKQSCIINNKTIVEKEEREKSEKKQKNWKRWLSTLQTLFFWKRSVNTDEENAKEKKTAASIQRYARCDSEEVLGQLKANLLGLITDEVIHRLARDGKNDLPAIKPAAWYTMLIAATLHPFNILLMTMGIISVAVPGQGPDTIIFVSVMVVISTAIRFSQGKLSNSAHS